MRSFITIILLLSALLSRSQATITGMITTKSITRDYSGFTITLLHAKDSSIISNTAAAKNGSYSFINIATGQYRIAATAIGFQKSYSPLIQLEPGKLQYEAPLLQLIPTATSLAGITITAQRPLVEQKADRLIVNVDAAVTNTGLTALEILEKSPGISIDKDGTVTLKGKPGAQVYIDGRPVQMEGNDLLNYLRNLNASQMDQVEIMTNPPARYDASGTAGIINIKTKKTRMSGMNGSGSVTLSQGRYPKTNEGFNFNYRVNKFNFFSSINHSYRKDFEVLTIQRRIRNSSTGATENYFDQRADEKGAGQSYNGKAGLDFLADKKTSMGIVFNAALSDNDEQKQNITNIADETKVLSNVTLANVATRSEWKNYGSSFYFRRLLDTTGKEISTDLDYARYESRYDQFMVNSYFDASENSIAKPDSLLGSLPQEITIYSGRIDYLHPLKKGSKLELGIKSSIVRTGNDAQYDSIQNGMMVHDVLRSNHFIYEENINAAYVNWSGKLNKKLEAQFGLRLENTQARGRQLTTAQNFERSYTHLFPTAYFQYKLDANNNLGLNYGKRIRRPNYSSLNPFIRFIDRYTYSKGNPDLRPQFSQTIEISHSYKNKITTTINYGYNNDIIQQVIDQEGQETFSTMANLATMQQFGIAVSANNNITRWWSSNMYVNVFYNRLKGVFDQQPLLISGGRLSLSGSQQFKFSKTFTGELSGNYRSGGVMGVLRTKALWQLTAGFSKQVMKNNGSIRLTVRDIFYSIKRKAVAQYGNVDASFQEIEDTRVVSVGFTYKFSKGKNGAPKKRGAGSAGEELGRVGMD